MTTLFTGELDLLPNPIDIVEDVISTREWSYERTSSEELAAELNGAWCNLRVLLSWRPEIGALLITCMLDAKVPEKCRQKVYHLLGIVNERLWFGHFDLCSEDGSLAFRHALLLKGSGGASFEQIEDILDIAHSECERFYPALQSVLWSGKAPEEAVEIAIFDTVGEA